MTAKPDQFLLALNTLKQLIWDFHTRHGVDPVRVHSPLEISNLLRRDPRIMRYLSFNDRALNTAYFMGIEWIMDSDAYAVVGPDAGDRYTYTRRK